ncbi:MAG: ABC transporter permease [Thermoleophilia bacterium]|nr:ABC transporter permease [Thermoleophilia bacterium]
MRDRTAMFFSFAFPLIFMTLFGALLNTEPSQPRVVVSGTGQLAQAFRSADAWHVERGRSRQQALHDVRKENIDGLVEVRAPDSVVVHYSGAVAQTAAVVQGIAGNIANEATLRQPGANVHRVRLTARKVEASSLTYIDFLVPGLIAMAIAQSAVFGMSGSLVAWRERGLLVRLQLSPVRLTELVGARLLCGLVLAIVQVLALLGVGVGLFGVDLSGALWAAVPIAALGALSFLMLGTLVGSFTRSEESVRAVANIVVLPMLFISGVFFPTEGAPQFVQVCNDLLPMKYLVHALRSVTVSGGEFADIWRDLAAMCVFIVVLGAVSMRSFRWSQD